MSLSRGHFLLFLSSLFTGLCFASQNPDWTDYNQRQALYPKNQYLTGFATTNVYDKNQVGQTLSRLENDARNELVQSIQSTIKVKSSTNTQSTNVNNSDFGFSQKFNDFTEVSSEAKVIGLKVETFYDKKSKTGYAMAYILISDLVNYYKNQVDIKMDEAKSLIDEGKNDLLSGKTQMAFPKFEKALAIYPKTAEPKNMLLALGKNQMVAMFDNEVNDAKAEIATLVNQAIDMNAGGVIVKANQSEVEIDLQSSTFVDVVLTQKGSAAPVPNFPVAIVYPDQKQTIAQALTDNAGKVKLQISNLQLNSKLFSLKAMPDVSQLFGADTSTFIYKSYIDNNNAIPSVNLVARVKKFTVCIESNEKSMDKPLLPYIISPRIKEELSTIGGTFITNQEAADFVFTVNANTILVSQSDYVSVVQAEGRIAVIQNKTGAQLLGKNYPGFRGYGKTPDLATTTAYTDLCKSVIIDIKGCLVK